MILCHEDIVRAFGSGVWKAFRDGEHIGPDSLTVNPNSVNCSMGNIALRPELNDGFVDPHDPDSVSWKRAEGWKSLLLQDGQFALVHVRERFDCVAPIVVAGRWRVFIPMIEGRSTLARCGLSVHATAGFGDRSFGSPNPDGSPGGNFTLELTTALPVILRPGDEIAQVYFVEGSCDGTHYSGVYAGQADEPNAPVLGRSRFQRHE